jgi:hypothetical protein
MPPKLPVWPPVCQHQNETRAGQESWSAGLQPAFSGTFWEKPGATRRSIFCALPSNFFVLHQNETRAAQQG